MLVLAFVVTGFTLQPIALEHAACARAAVRAPSPTCAIELPSQVKDALKDLEVWMLPLFNCRPPARHLPASDVCVRKPSACSEVLRCSLRSSMTPRPWPRASRTR